jgi:hypothetical protein
VRVRDALPRFAAELTHLLAASTRPELAEQLTTLEVASRCACGDYFCSTFYVSRGRSPLTEEQQKDRGPHWGQRGLDVNAKEGTIVVDLDRVDRIVSVQVLYRPDVEAELASALERMRRAL